MDILTLGAALLAGVLTFLNPCVLPVLPIVFGAASAEHRFGPLAIAAGLAISFTFVGLFIATVGFSLGLDASVFRTISGTLLIAFGAILAMPKAQAVFQTAMGPVAAWGNERSDRFGGKGRGLGGQFGVGALLGAVWSPCVGPTLGAATLLASQSEQLGSVALTMGIFGIGAAIPLLLIGTVGQKTMVRLRGRMAATGAKGRTFLGGAMIFAGALVVTGLDKRLEIAALKAMPTWLIQLTTSI
ncbi:cytochrome c biogenesis protein CcdA [Pacificimonas sp. WHA3]|uniref:Cytochrome c biogenesis protein CcdA n=1 Tax=Pacificimonas pallii TaxID=2827236 RepID=A0ABS6SCL8_9SPHN|nr:cytochrome c biogenesis CcdA family protein [Pacificimonas pallii]MBV7255671.1 cytochrome c biogenesis protein CcdA [Pacificimonas pallii]